ncbi:transmembrane carbonic anhydrase SulP [Mycobacteroides abscessus subsp. abscessus]|nr:transmembrane carbonic anhydrase SulP [Mycobacteroides abscessus subsp. abscessus]
MIIGLVLAFALLLWRVVRVTIVAEQIPQSQRWLVRIDGSCTFLALPRLSGELAKVPAGADVTVEMTAAWNSSRSAACAWPTRWPDRPPADSPGRCGRRSSGPGGATRNTWTR